MLADDIEKWLELENGPRSRGTPEVELMLTNANDLFNRVCEQRRWRNVHTELPPYGDHVLAFNGSCVQEDCCFGEADEWDSETNVTHWMPLPEGPKLERKA
jgi:hypothetical protein